MRAFGVLPVLSLVLGVALLSAAADAKPPLVSPRFSPGFADEGSPSGPSPSADTDASSPPAARAAPAPSAEGCGPGERAAGAGEVDEGRGTDAATHVTLGEADTDLEKTPPPPTNIAYLQYGVAFTAEMVGSPGPVCDTPQAPCILGSGGGIAVRVGARGMDTLYVGGAYEATKQDPNKLYQVAVLQQLRGELRKYFTTGRQTEPYLTVGAGVAGYGNLWEVDTWGPAGFLGAGVEYQISRRIVVGVALAYRVLSLSRFTDTSGALRAPGAAQLVGLDLILEQRDPIFTRGSQAEPSR